MLNELRKTCNKTRRAIKVIRRKGVNTATLEEELRAQRKKLAFHIRKAKRAKWTGLINQLNNDVWVDAYKIVTKQMGMQHPRIEMTTADRELILKTLFPRGERPKLVAKKRTEPIRAATEYEIRMAARKLKNGRAPGIDGIPAEAVKLAALIIPDYIAQVFTKLM